MFLLSNYKIKSFIVRDPIYDFIEVPEIFKSIVDHKLVQRLRWINQLPLEQLVYPSAQHSRFEHSLGVMYLAMLAANSLIKNSEKDLSKAFSADNIFKKYGTEKRNEYFILSAGLAGLLHDVGHAPFSHTLEEACKYSKIKYKYNHEEIGRLLSIIILKDTSQDSTPFAQKALSVLNKNLITLNKHLTPIEMLIRKLIDGPIDVDKGDYIIRDSYHCGTSYGVYDIQRLWRNIVINPNDFTIAINKKGALEAWALRFQRYRMYRNVYRHHTRNITDSMLIDIIVSSIEKVKRKKRIKLDLIPIWQASNEINKEENKTKFVFWTDNGLLKNISDLDDTASLRIESFLKRDIYKRGKIINLKSYPEALASATKKKGENAFLLQNKLMNLKNKLKKDKDLSFDFLIGKDDLPPVFENAVQQDIKVLTEHNKFIKLSEFLNFSISEIIKNKTNNGEDVILPSSDYKLHLYIEKNSKNKKDIIYKEVENFLEDFSKIK